MQGNGLVEEPFGPGRFIAPEMAFALLDPHNLAGPREMEALLRSLVCL